MMRSSRPVISPGSAGPRRSRRRRPCWGWPWARSLAADPAAALRPPGGEHLLGTDAVGRDLAARVLAGARLSLLVGLLSRLVALLLGAAAGLLAGYFGGWLDGVVMRLADMTLAFPPCCS
ncbi:MAG: hypothetical protein H6694_03140 [Candidatus Latescibacteria bacterium]|nr:hypothetical protein [Candidatus Latescibacterota bacterium]